MKTLSIIDTAYRATIEEQDDPIIWLGRALQNAGAEVDILLSGNAVNYAVRGQKAGGLRFGDRAQTQPPDIERELAAFGQKGGAVFFIEEDARARGIEKTDLVERLQPIGRGALVSLLEQYERVWQF